MKRYSITVKKVETASMDVSAKSHKEAILKVRWLLLSYMKKNMDMKIIFDKKPIFKYKSHLRKGHEKY